MIEAARLADLEVFARIEVGSRDVEPWADLLAALYAAGDVDEEEALWLVKLYNAYDDLGSAWQVFRRWPTPLAWYVAGDGHAAAAYPCTQERRNLRGGMVLRHLSDYVARLAGGSQRAWIERLTVDEDTPTGAWRAFRFGARQVWGVGRQTAFEWAEFVAKVTGRDMTAPDADLWQSEGPRRSLQRLYGNPEPTPGWLDEVATYCRADLASAGIALSWEDFETIICDFNVMRDGRYYPGRHLAALRAEICAVSDTNDQIMLTEAFDAVIPAPWNGIAPGIDKSKLPVYRDTGHIIDKP